MTNLKSLRHVNPTTISLLLITVLSLLAYFPLIPYLGFYSDDFFFGYVAHFYGSQGLIESLIIDRPAHGYLLAFLYQLLGDNVLLWHICMFIVRLFGGYALFYLLKKLWPDKLSVITSITLLFLIYPGFLEQPLPLGFGIWILTLTVWTYSVFFTILAIKANKKLKAFLFTFFALILQISVFFLLEFFIGTEILRILLIMYVLKVNFNFLSLNTFRKILSYWKYWSPYVTSMGIFLLWRILIFKSIRPETDINWVMQTYYSNPLWIAKIPLEVLYSGFSTIALSYFLPILIRIPRIPLNASVIALSLGAIAALLLYLYFKTADKWKKDQNLDNSLSVKMLGKQLLIIGLITVTGALIPIIISGRYVRLFYAFDRYTITSIAGASFFLIGFLLYKISSPLRKVIIISLVALSVTTHITNSFLFSLNWDKQKNIWWQLYWRSPKIRDEAMLIFYFPDNINQSLFKNLINKTKWHRIYWVDYQIWAPGNLFFNYEDSPQKHFRGDFLQDIGIPEKIKNQAVDSIKDRNITYVKDFKNTVIISTPNDQSCLWILDGNRLEFPDSSDELLINNIKYSDADKLLQKDNKTSPPSVIFGREPSHNWCYFFQKASLARQLQDWSKLTQLTKEVTENNLQPKDPNEWLPFIEGLIFNKHFLEAEKIINEVLQNNSSKVFYTNLCSLLNRTKTTQINISCQD
ncbi:MAG: hypothetical protein ACD_32C00113G0020 [uncultured bacterium]|uniref:Putative membrane protein n=1 Tax=Candidatus Daviesbacteria bacterium GW2011_GWC2_40_12 TaxID=1618431 RepID=A0A0G0QRA2_9BACT|nr:MAG: hypothetical protein ACD_32C00113G0020 [uncultured bacterium]KKR17259.1 MAG: putative membrane protein [Candidatus Daviesbacteria bacterium GW2011_GWA2_39_33]KKR24436.1 MAG: putative membrane protein [Candidatus Daviesbacteria bacterium GW2011_GWB1_39_5]KKR42658.1 MAG: putative membrane protein [Candidatus Daviesbacteria bacterium GW2011_GWC2_40_12]OGE21333.1 MAG: hypothetical protein A2778_04155 [Candidatus Daviesbacteria bacterium RIFCSPHIGHO2_01_FULL_40_24]OGE30149.1 MAG: hypothetic